MTSGSVAHLLADGSGGVEQQSDAAAIGRHSDAEVLQGAVGQPHYQSFTSAGQAHGCDGKAAPRVHVDLLTVKKRFNQT